ncbi:Synaptosomal-associated protein 29 [Fasciola hepatica]|uniref:Synaptosomal-associated protein 29 n=1 Tax=Fasciola hepatica TaxID=6192 RepID=A0A4E0RB68_FASHE|nr:Synaptosomal-associated protein 29 [Fasciola hepatica]
MSRNPFDEDCVPGSFGFSGTSGLANNGPGWLKTETPFSGGDYSFQAQIQDSQSRTRSSQQRALASIANSERIGVETANELLEQGEKLSRAEQQLDEISHLQKDSQRQINTLSSVFGGLKTFFSRKQSTPSGPTTATSTNPRPNEPARSTSSLRHSVSSQPTWSASLPAQEDFAPSRQNDTEFERNLGLMSDGVSRLKGLAQGLNEELRLQNEQLDRMAPRVDSVTDTMTRQNQQMNKLLGVKPK